MKCAIKNCPNTDKRRDKNRKSFFRFPRDPELSKQWLAFCDRPEAYNFHTWKVCSAHFRPEQITGQLQCSLGVERKKNVEKGAVPTIFPVNPEDKEREELKRIEERKKLVSSLLEASGPIKKIELRKIESVILRDSRAGCAQKNENFIEESCVDETPIFDKSNFENNIEEYCVDDSRSCDYEVKKIITNFDIKSALKFESDEPGIEEESFSRIGTPCVDEMPSEYNLKTELKASKIEIIQLKRKIFELQEALRKKDFEVEVFKKCVVKLGNRQR